jgi:hypothetical protein
MDGAQIYGTWRHGPWMAERTSNRTANGSVRGKPRYVIELKLPHEPYSMKEYRFWRVRDLVAWWIRHSPAWRRAEQWAALADANLRARG